MYKLILQMLDAEQIDEYVAEIEKEKEEEAEKKKQKKWNNFKIKFWFHETYYLIKLFLNVTKLTFF